MTTKVTSSMLDGSAVTLGPSLVNGRIAASVGSNALTLSLKTHAGTDPSAADPVHVVFRSGTATSGALNVRTVTSALSVVISSGSTLGHASAIVQHLFVYLIDNSGTVEMAVSNLPPTYSSVFRDARLISTTAEGGAGAADSATGIYSTTARTNVPWLAIAMCKSNQTVAGTWAAVPTQIDMAPFAVPVCPVFVYRSSNQSINNASITKIQHNAESFDHDSVFDTTTNYRFQPNVAGLYRVSIQQTFNSLGDQADNQCYLHKNGSTHVQAQQRTSGSNLDTMQISALVLMNGTSDYLENWATQNSGAAADMIGDAGASRTFFAAERIG